MNPIVEGIRPDDGPVPPLIRSQWPPLITIALTTIAAAGAAIVFFFDPEKYGFYPVCYLHVVTGLNCPGCGATRALHELLHGHVAAAARMNLLLVLCLPFSAWRTMHHTAGWLRGRPEPFPIRPAWLWTFLALCVAFTVLRNLPGFEWLAP